MHKAYTTWTVPPKFVLEQHAFKCYQHATCGQYLATF